MKQEIYDRCISAHQSWIKTSGHSFERFVAGTASDLLRDNEIGFFLQSDLTEMIKQAKLANTQEDTEGLNLGERILIYGHSKDTR